MDVMNTERKWTEVTKAKIARILGGESIFGGEYPIDAIEEVASIIIERDIAPEPDKVAEFIEADEEPWTPSLNPYLDPPDNVMLPVIINCAVVLAIDPVYAAYVRADLEAIRLNRLTISARCGGFSSARSLTTTPAAEAKRRPIRSARADGRSPPGQAAAPGLQGHSDCVSETAAAAAVEAGEPAMIRWPGLSG